MSDDSEVLVKNDEEPPKKSKKKLIIIIAGASVLLVVLAVVAFLFLGKKEDKTELSIDTETPQPVAVEDNKATFLTLDPITVNMNTADGTPRFLQIQVVLELAKKEDEVAITEVQPRIMDAFQSVLRELRPSDFYGSQGVYRLKDILKRLINQEAYPVRVKNVLITKLLVQ